MPFPYPMWDLYWLQHNPEQEELIFLTLGNTHPDLFHENWQCKSKKPRMKPGWVEKELESSLSAQSWHHYHPWLSLTSPHIPPPSHIQGKLSGPAAHILMLTQPIYKLVQMCFAACWSRHKRLVPAESTVWIILPMLQRKQWINRMWWWLDFEWLHSVYAWQLVWNPPFGSIAVTVNEFLNSSQTHIKISEAICIREH